MLFEIWRARLTISLSSITSWNLVSSASVHYLYHCLLFRRHGREDTGFYFRLWLNIIQIRSTIKDYITHAYKHYHNYIMAITIKSEWDHKLKYHPNPHLFIFHLHTMYYICQIKPDLYFTLQRWSVGTWAARSFQPTTSFITWYASCTELYHMGDIHEFIILINIWRHSGLYREII